MFNVINLQFPITIFKNNSLFVSVCSSLLFTLLCRIISFVSLKILAFSLFWYVLEIEFCRLDTHSKCIQFKQFVPFLIQLLNFITNYTRVSNLYDDLVMKRLFTLYVFSLYFINLWTNNNKSVINIP